MKRLFLDASVLFAAAHSGRGHARDLLLMGIRQEVTLVVSTVVLTEARRNLNDTDPILALLFDRLVAETPFEVAKPTKRDVSAATKHVVVKDAPIVAAAKRAKVDLLVTFDRKHLLSKPEVAKYGRAVVVTPQEAVAYLQGKN